WRGGPAAASRIAKGSAVCPGNTIDCRQVEEIILGELKNLSTDPDLLKNAYEDLNKIDWILYKGAVKVLKYEVVDYNVNGEYPSDHKPVVVEFEIQKN
ncbi:MAG: hypothetical protein MUE99_09210, partial [Chitinophagaceae bacterium]|nr:hypothetical protein [Chitinophagaceae bacterium]